MPTSAAAKRLIEVPADVWAALRLKPGAPVQWEVRGSEAVMRAAARQAAARQFTAAPNTSRTARPTTVADVAGMLASKLPRKKIDWDAAARSALINWGKLR